MPQQFQQIAEPTPRLAVVVSTYNAWITQPLLAGACAAYARQVGSDADLHIAEAAGAFEITALCRGLAASGQYDGLVALGCVIRGETAHFDYICDSVTSGLTEITLRTGIPIGFGLLTCENKEQAEARAGGSAGNKGEEAMQAALHTIATLRGLPRPQDSSGRTPTSMCEHATATDPPSDSPSPAEVRPPVTSLVASPEESTAPAAAAIGPMQRSEAEPRLIRQLALLALYQFDARGEEDAGDVSDNMPMAGLSLLQREEDELPHEKGPKGKKPAAADPAAADPAAADPGFAEGDLRLAYDLARGAYDGRAEADELMRELAPDWPPERQPTVDRCILRLAYHEMVTGRTPPKAAINEAVELAKRFSTDRSPLFVNGVLDKVMRRLAPKT
jgi:6,7-dimethyl-8-ribityllumazine synthase